MKVRNRRSGREFETTRDFFENVIVAKGNADVYDVIEDDAPLEVKELSKVLEIKRKTSKAPETPEVNKTNGD